MIVISAAHAFFRMRHSCPVVGRGKCAKDQEAIDRSNATKRLH